MTQPITLAPVTRTISTLLYDCLVDGWGIEDVDDIALFVASQLSTRPDPDNPRRWWITLPSADGSDPDEEKRS